MVNIKSPFKKRPLYIKVLDLLHRRGEMRACLIREILTYGDVNGTLLRLLNDKMVERVSRGVYKITDKGEQKLNEEGM